MKRAALLFIFALCTSAAAPTEDAAKWIKEPPKLDAATKKEEVAPTDFFEVVASKAGVAISDLTKKEFVALSENDARWFTGAYYSCPKGKKPFLVRAVFGYGGTGRYRLERIGDALLVSHSSLGDELVASRSALVVNLEFSPTAVYSTVSIAR
jgi:hypothetical protein